MSTCETVKVVSEEHDTGFKTINKEDFDEKVHKLFLEEEKEPEKSTQNKKNK